MKIIGRVIHGLGNGKKIGMPTANLDIKDIHEDITFGVYACKVLIDDTYYLGVCNIGNRPTIDSNKTVEVTILDFNEDIYDKDIEIDLIEKLRDIKKFDNLNDVKKQVDKDIIKTREIVKL